MQIPKSLESSWNQVSKDGTISRDDYKTLLRGAKTLSEDGTSVNKEVVDFLKGLNSQLETSTKEGGIPVASVVSFSSTDGSSLVSEKSIGDVPESLKTAWSKISSDNKITKEEYGSLLKFASAPENKALGQGEQDFLKNLQVLILSSKDIEVNIKTNKPAKDEQPVATAPVKEPVKTAPAASNDVVTPQITTKKDSNTLEDPTIDNLNEIKALLAKIGDDPDLAPLKGIVDKRIDNSNKLKDFSSKVNDVYSSVQGSSDPKKLQGAKAVFQTEYNNLGDLKDLDSAKTLFQNATGYVDSQLSKLSEKSVNTPPKKEKPTQVTQTRPTEQQPKKPAKVETKPNLSFVDGGKVPEALKSDWDKISADNKVTAEELNDMLDNARTTVNARPDKTILPNEEAFLRNLSKKVGDAGGDLILKKETPAPVVTPKPTSTGSKVPESLKADFAKISADNKITAEEFNSMLDNMKKAVSARPDKAILPDEEAFLRDLNKKLNDAGGDLVLKKETPAPVVTTPKPTSTGSKAPESLKADFAKISADNKITSDEFNAMLENMKKIVSSRADKKLLPDEEAFLRSLSKKINDAGGELKITNK